MEANLRVDYTFPTHTEFGKSLMRMMMFRYRGSDCIVECFSEYNPILSTMTGGEERVIFDMPVDQHLLFLDLLEDQFYENRQPPEQFAVLRKALVTKKKPFKLKRLKNWDYKNG